MGNEKRRRREADEQQRRESLPDVYQGTGRKNRLVHVSVSTVATRAERAMRLGTSHHFADRLAPYTHPKKGKGFKFICQRLGHAGAGKSMEAFIPGSKVDASAFRAAHDTAFHNTILRHVGF